MKIRFSQVITSPIMLLLSFSIILVGSPNFGGPYLLFLIGSISQGLLYGIVGIIGIALALLGAFFPNKRVILLSICLMIISLTIHFIGAPYDNFTVTFFDVIPLITVLLFCSISAAIVIKAFSKQSTE